MDILDDFISTVDAMLDSRRKRHITGGILLSAALLFGGLAITVVTIQACGKSLASAFDSICATNRSFRIRNPTCAEL